MDFTLVIFHFDSALYDFLNNIQLVLESKGNDMSKYFIRGASFQNN